MEFGLKTGIGTPRLGFEHQDRSMGLEAEILALEVIFEPWGWDLGLRAWI